MKLFACGFGGITNVNGDANVGIEDIHFLDQFMAASPMLGARHSTVAFETAISALALDAQHEVILGPRIYVPPAAPIADNIGKLMLDNLIDALGSKGQVDAVVILTTGALFDLRLRDLLGTLLEKIRDAVGEKAFIGVLAGEYGPITIPVMINADAVISMKDVPEDARRACSKMLDIAVKSVAGNIRPVTYMVTSPGTKASGSEAFASDMDGLLAEMEKQRGIIATSVCWSAAGTSLQSQDATSLVVTNDDFDLARVVAENMGTEVTNLCIKYAQKIVTVREAFRELANAGHRLTVLVDTGDNPAQGASGESTLLLREILARSIHNVAFGPIICADAVRRCIAAGVGNTIAITLLGAYSATAPMALTVTVESLAHSLKQISSGREINCGAAVSVSLQDRPDIQLVLLENREEMISVHMFTELGIRLDAKRVLVVKSAAAPTQSSLPSSAQVVIVSTVGATHITAPRSVPYRADILRLGM